MMYEANGENRTAADCCHKALAIIRRALNTTTQGSATNSSSSSKNSTHRPLAQIPNRCPRSVRVVNPLP
jgi:hypothetical protein